MNTLQELSEVVISDWEVILGGAEELKKKIDNFQIDLGIAKLDQHAGIILLDSEYEWASPDNEKITEIISVILSLIETGNSGVGTPSM